MVGLRSEDLRLILELRQFFFTNQRNATTKYLRKFKEL